MSQDRLRQIRRGLAGDASQVNEPLIRTSALYELVRDDASALAREPVDHPAADLRLLRVPDPAPGERNSAPGGGAAASPFVDHVSGPAEPRADHAHRYTDLQTLDRPAAEGSGPVGQDEDKVNSAAVAAYRASLEGGRPLSERRLAAMYGKTSRRWARNHIADARRVPTTATAEL